MALRIFTTIRNTSDIDEDGSGLLLEDVAILKELEDNDDPVEVLRNACDGYFDIVTSEGHEIEALSWLHLDGFNEDGPDL